MITLKLPDIRRQKAVSSVTAFWLLKSERTKDVTVLKNRKPHIYALKTVITSFRKVNKVNL